MTENFIDHATCSEGLLYTQYYSEPYINVKLYKTNC